MKTYKKCGRCGGEIYLHSDNTGVSHGGPMVYTCLGCGYTVDADTLKPYLNDREKSEQRRKQETGGIQELQERALRELRQLGQSYKETMIENLFLKSENETLLHAVQELCKTLDTVTKRETGLTKLCRGFPERFAAIRENTRKTLDEKIKQG